MIQLRFFFDSGSGTCLWAANPAAHAAHGYAVDHHALPLSPALRTQLDHLIARHDTRLDWSNPGGPSPWTTADHAAFTAETAATLAALRAELAPHSIEILD